MHPFTVVAIMTMANITVMVSSSPTLVFLVWTTTLVGIIYEGFIKTHLIFLAATMAPMFIALLVVWTSAKDVPDVVFDVYGGSVLIYVTFLSLRIAAVGGVLQWLFLPMIRDQALENFLSKIKCNKTLILAVTSAVVLLHDFKRRSQIVMEARMARGLVGRTRLSKWKSFLSTISPVVYTSILSGINRSDLWTHRGIDVVEYRAANSRNNQNLKITEFLLIFWFLLLVTLIWFIN